MNSEFTTLLNTYYERVNVAMTLILQKLPFQNSSLVNAMLYGTLLGGKRLRPFLVYATGEMLQGNLSVLDIPAAAIEFIHAYSLIHDDLPVIDNDTLRRGKQTCHIKYGEDIAILAGNALQTLAFSILADQPMSGVNNHRRIAMISELARASGVTGMCSGQALDISLERQKIDLKKLEEMYQYKTGALIRASVRLGALTVIDSNNILLLALDTYSNAIGLAFQIQDDILNIIGDTSVLGKKQGTDQKMNKNTYPSMIGITNARIKASNLCKQALEALDTIPQSYNTTILQVLANFIIKRNK